MPIKAANKATHLLRGQQTEEQALQFLLQQGLQLVERNYRCKQGELDLIMQDQATLVIIEVRFRKTNTYGSALESITPRKQAHIIAATQYYIIEQHITTAIRFDVIACSGDGTLHWIKNAF